MTAVIRSGFWIACALAALLSFLPSAYLDASVFNWWDKAQHALAFFLLGVVGLRAYPDFAGRILTGLLLYGGVIELGQGAVPWRTGDFKDWLADGLGLALAALLWHLVFRQRLRTKIVR